MNDEIHITGNGAACECGGARRGRSGKWVWMILAVAVAVVLLAKKDGSKEIAAIRSSGAGVHGGGTSGTASRKALPRLVDLGAGTCATCKMMVPVLAELKANYAGQLDVQFIDVRENVDTARTYGISMIPTQLFYDADGNELFRHEGFMSREDILEKWKLFGVELVSNPAGNGKSE